MDAFLGRNVDQNKAGTSGMEKSNVANKKLAVMPWVEKYRPKTVDDVAHQDEVVAVLGKLLQGADFPNLLFYGPPGTGKTSTILALSRQLFGDNFRGRILELNASDERGIQVIRDKVKSFAQMTASGVRPDGTPCPPFKIVILDEADSMTNSAQAALRRTMERESKTTRFCLLCNYVSRIIEPLTSRCAKFRFKALSAEVLLARLRNVCEREGVAYDSSALTAVEETSEGDLRKAITALQSAHRLKGELGIVAEDVYELSGRVPNSWVEGLLPVCETNSYEKLDDFVKKLMAEGYAVSQFVKQLNRNVVENGALSDAQKAEICERAAICDHRLMDGADEYLQVMDLCLVIMTQIHRSNK